MTREQSILSPPPAASTCSLPPTPLGDRPSLSLPGTRGACLPRHAAPDRPVTNADILRQLPCHPPQIKWATMWRFIHPAIVLSLTPAPQGMRASWTGPLGHRLSFPAAPAPHSCLSGASQNMDPGTSVWRCSRCFLEARGRPERA